MPISSNTLTIKGEKETKSEAGHKQIEHRLTASEVRYRRLFETAQDGILILNAKTGRIADVNPFLIDMLGYSKHEFLEKRLWEIGVAVAKKASKCEISTL